MISLEQVKLLESKVTRTIDYVKKITDENTKLKEKLDSCEKRTGELEVMVQRFKEEQSRIEDGILSALDRLNQFEDALESKLSPESKIPEEKKPAQAAPSKKHTEPAAPVETVTPVQPAQSPEEDSDPALNSAELDIF